MQVNLSLSAYSDKTYLEAMQIALNEHTDDHEQFSLQHIEISPKNIGILNESIIDALRALSPQSLFRLHANVRVDQNNHYQATLSNFFYKKTYFKRLAELHRYMGATAYTLHPGGRPDCEVTSLPDLLKELSDCFECRVGVEPMYPAAGHKHLLDCWSEYQWLLQSGMDYVLNLNHFSIIARRQRKYDNSLLMDLLASPCCIEIHVPDSDSGGALPWWHEHLANFISKQKVLDRDGPVIFIEGR